MSLHQLTALAQAAAVRAGEFTAVELTEHYLRRTEHLNDEVGAFITVIADDALDQARRVDDVLRRGEAPDSPLLGVIAPVKDLDLMAGVRCTFGSTLFADFVAPTDAEFVSRMRAAGLIITGKTNTPEFGLPCYTENQIAPPARTPWDLSRSAGGSSGGAAAAVSTGLASIAQGSDGGGSIRIPASVTGLVGIKPSRGRVGMAPLVDQLGELAVVGPLARTVADAAAFLDILAGGSVGDPFAHPPLTPGHFLAAAQQRPTRLRIGRYRDPVIADTELDPECIAAYENTSQLLLELGHELVDIERPFSPEAVPAFEAVWDGGVAALPLPADADDHMVPLSRWLRDRGQRRSAAEVFHAVQRMRETARAAIEATERWDAVLTPTLAHVPAPVGGLRDDGDPAADFQAQKEFTPFTAPYNVTGQPAISLPQWWSPAGLPIGVQLVGRPGDESTIISLAAQLEEAAPRPPTHDLWD